MSTVTPQVSPQLRGGRAQLALAGVLAGGAGLALSQAVAWGLRSRTSPVVAVAEVVRDLTPGPMAHLLIGIVGQKDKPLLLLGTTLVTLALTAYAGLLTRRHPLFADLIFLALGAIGLVAVLTRPGAGITAAIALIIGLVTWIVVLRFLTNPVLDHPETGRRDFLIRSGVVVVGSGAALAIGRFAGRGRRAVESARRLLRLPVTKGSEPAGAALRVKGIAPWRTRQSRFYLIDTALAPPSIRPSDWQLRIHGDVEREVVITYDQLLQRKFTEAWITLCCVSNEVGGDLIGNAWWSGVPVREFLAMAGPKAGANAVFQTSYDGWNCATPLAALTDDRNALLAVAMNGEPLEVEHGFPVRTIVPGLYGYVSATKWVVDMKVTSFDKVEAFWTQRGWSELGPVKTQSRIDVPRDGEPVTKGVLRVGGSAWAQHRGVSKVEFSLDGGPWQEATLGRVPDADTWVQWSGEVDVSRGDHELRVRATDSTGETQTAVRTDVIPNGATGWHTVGFVAS